MEEALIDAGAELLGGMLEGSGSVKWFGIAIGAVVVVGGTLWMIDNASNGQDVTASTARSYSNLATSNGDKKFLRQVEAGAPCAQSYETTDGKRLQMFPVVLPDGDVRMRIQLETPSGASPASDITAVMRTIAGSGDLGAPASTTASTQTVAPVRTVALANSATLAIYDVPVPVRISRDTPASAELLTKASVIDFDPSEGIWSDENSVSFELPMTALTSGRGVALGDSAVPEAKPLSNTICG